MSSYLVVILEGAVVIIFLAAILILFFLRETGNLPWEREKIEKMPPEAQKALVVAIFKVSLIQSVGMCIMFLAVVVLYVYRDNAQVVRMLSILIAAATIYLMFEILRAKRL